MADTTEKGTEALLEEYRQLKSEMADWSRVRNQFIMMSLTATAALYGIGFEWQNAFIFLAALLVQLPTMAICMAERRSILAISAYIQLLIEPRFKELNWETMVHRRLTSGKWHWIHPLTAGVEAFVVLPPLLSLVFAAIHWPWIRDASGSINWGLMQNSLYLIVVVVVLVSAGAFIFSYARESSIREKSLDGWRACVPSKTPDDP